IATDESGCARDESSHSSDGLDAHDLHVNFAIVWPVEFREKNLLPLTELEMSVFDWDREAVSHHDRAQVRISILTVTIGEVRIVVFVVNAARNDLLEHHPHIR